MLKDYCDLTEIQIKQKEYLCAEKYIIKSNNKSANKYMP